MNKWFKNFLAGCAFALGILAVGVTLVGVHAASVPLMTGPAGSNPVNNPSVLGDLNSLIVTIQTQITPGGTGTVSGLLNVTGSPTSTPGVETGTLPTMLQFSNLGSWTAAATSKCPVSASITACLIVSDMTGTIHYIPAY